MLRQYELVDRVLSYDPNADEALINRAYVFSMKAHGNQKRASGDPYFSHPLEVAGILTDIHMDAETIVTAILHDTIEDTVATREQLEKLFGASVLRLVEGVTKLSRIEAQSVTERAAENLRKFLLAMSDDIRVLLVKLADRLHNMRTLHFIPKEEKRRRIARETMDIYAPLAERIGMYEFMREMQTLSFQFLEPEAYASITRRLEQLNKGDTGQIKRIITGIGEVLEKAGIKAKVSGRQKHPYSIWKKLEERHISFDQLSDVMAFRVIVDNTEDCYRALGILHGKWPMVPGRFKDYISTPRRNGYRSLHTAVIHNENLRIEIQIRSQAMHEQAEYGLAAHWAYKQKTAPDKFQQSGWIRDLVEILDNAESPEELLEHTKMAMYKDRIFAFTPTGELIQLPQGATPVDFAYAVHTDLGNQTVGAKINGRVVPLGTRIENGDQVDILRSAAQIPQISWLNFITTGKARAAIRRYVRNKERSDTLTLGRQLYETIIKRLPAPLSENALEAALPRLGLKEADDLFEAIALRNITDDAVIEALMPGMALHDASEPLPRLMNQAISIRGLTPGAAYELATCCHPVPGDRIVGLRRPHASIEVHVIDCPHLAETDPYDWVDLRWGDKAEGATVRLRVVVKNEAGALGVMATIFGAHKANIINLVLADRDENFHTFNVTLEVRDLQHLMRILAALRAADVVVQAEREQLLLEA
ncbi:MAG: bifunctional (p)ppGpp synthetase/guanosine-3',5'-bis(diphosphate) 3'-pyrophosphohydrolase [Zymomonas mobilis subsp. pomaceae]|uniref:GTP pyrophosphokinase rsh n=1 Tax=Zymomonas mobilis subsp. pomaceae (strain ATCC 29192 / DSM 22645 / JCM 10191 / CCUG 17912 / NBRC 13757 / NCIMB 11200 / NRRL B-4491 / Barker I) TaxID=579138 RepID=F8ETI4_ZYMMT|nr:bifunctional (p)ppGpp synthetase/guanosine-3',5'-bis(diphosphate) 3'-pyrophosphohydrolase [Zymomonas mobilis]AEI38009.1 (p)ppGpp synthetase I, SpoT/RelA [Zymomonas mobilis subsp. pomaceae ATCC 29192]MDX5949377.1 bifunctional (p)ppGpp synthetase/guanosine-3',5'-bis(diphosphate) 3'-pyrophosphohydrolase [Zymomonas mobilis subsp. pomaceae]GEB89119.1 GTP pyrophosphokinase [Zymomonas mobilis subsp. pomaceae]